MSIYKHFLLQVREKEYNFIRIKDVVDLKGRKFIGYIWLDDVSQSGDSRGISEYLDIYSIKDCSDLLI